jgi:hypothetical protein
MATRSAPSSQPLYVGRADALLSGNPPSRGVRREKVWFFSGCKSHPASLVVFHPVAIQAAVEATKPSEPWVERVRYADSARERAVTRVNVEQAPKTGNAGADHVPRLGRPPDATTNSRCGGQTHRKRMGCVSCRSNDDSTLSKEDHATREACLVIASDDQPDTREG